MDNMEGSSKDNIQVNTTDDIITGTSQQQNAYDFTS